MAGYVCENCDRSCCCSWEGCAGLGALEGTVVFGARTGVCAGEGVNCGGGGSQGKWATPREDSFFCQLCEDTTEIVLAVSQVARQVDSSE